MNGDFLAGVIVALVVPLGAKMLYYRVEDKLPEFVVNVIGKLGSCLDALYGKLGV